MDPRKKTESGDVTESPASKIVLPKFFLKKTPGSRSGNITGKMLGGPGTPANTNTPEKRKKMPVWLTKRPIFFTESTLQQGGMYGGRCGLI